MIFQPAVLLSEGAFDPGQVRIRDHRYLNGPIPSNQIAIETASHGGNVIAGPLEISWHPNDANPITDFEFPPRFIHATKCFIERIARANASLGY